MILKKSSNVCYFTVAIYRDPNCVLCILLVKSSVDTSCDQKEICIK